jgi:LysM repeat protein
MSLPLALGLLVILLGIGAAVVFFVLQSTGKVVEPTPTATQTATQTVTLTPTASLTSSPVPTFTPLPPVEYQVQANDTCISIAYAFKVSVISIVTLNNLSAECNTLSVGQKLQIPQPTPTPSPMPTSTLSAAEATDTACDKMEYVVKENDTLSTIAANYNVGMDAIRSYNNLPNETVYQGMTLIIPLCARLPTAGPTPTATPPPPYPAPNLLLPVDGTAYMAVNDVITLQWASVGTLRANESYAVSIEDLTGGSGLKVVDHVIDTKYIVPSSLRPVSNQPHIYRWTVFAARQTGTTKEGEPIWESGGAASSPRVFSWWGGNPAGATPTP